MIAILCGMLVEGRAPTVFGDGDQTRDYVHVSDVVRANLLAADAEQTGAWNIAWGRETSVLQLIETLDSLGERKLPPAAFAPERPGEVRRSCLDVSRARDGLGWAATMQLPDGLRTILAGL